MKYDIKIQDVDLNLLRDQKEILVELQYKTARTGISVFEFNALQGIVHLIDHIQDQAVKQHNLKEEDVYKFTNED